MTFMRTTYFHAIFIFIEFGTSFNRIWKYLEIALKICAALTLNDCNIIIIQLVRPVEIYQTRYILPATFINPLTSAIFICFDLYVMVSFFILGTTIVYFILSYIILTRSWLQVIM